MKDSFREIPSLIGTKAEALYARMIECDKAIPLAKYLQGTRYSIDQAAAEKVQTGADGKV